MNETWREIPGFPGYEASDLGRVRSLINTRGNPARTPKLKKPWMRGGYPIVTLTRTRGRTDSVKQVGHFVLLAFRGDPPPGTECSHLNGNQLDNRLANLAWETHLVNMARKADHGTIVRGEAHGQARLTEREVAVIRRLLDGGVPGRTIALAFEVGEATVSQIRSGTTWQ